jgi:membrane protein DedA with SNARE-associated domain
VRNTEAVLSSHDITQLVHEYGIALVFIAVALQATGFPVPGTSVLIAASLYAASAHGLPIVWVIVAGALGALAGTSAGFALGRRGGEDLLVRVGRRLRQSPERVQLLRREFAAHGGSWLLVGRFISGLRNVTGLLAGASGMPAARFVALSAVAANVWATVNALEYYFFGRALAAADTWVQVVIVCAGLAWLVFSLGVLRRRALSRLEGAATTASEG